MEKKDITDILQKIEETSFGVSQENSQAFCITKLIDLQKQTNSLQNQINTLQNEVYQMKRWIVYRAYKKIRKIIRRGR